MTGSPVITETATAPTSWIASYSSVIVRYRYLVLTVWLMVLVGCGAGYPVLNARLQALVFSVDNSESAAVDRLMARHFDEVGVEQDVIVFTASAGTIDAPVARSAIGAAERLARDAPGVRRVVGPFDAEPAVQVSADRRVAFAVVGIDGDPAQRAAIADELQGTLMTLSNTSIRVMLTGYSPVQNDLVDVDNADVERAETIGIPAALLILLIALGTVGAAVLPIVVALAGVATTLGVMFLASITVSFDVMTVSMASMIGTGIGIDYALFVVSRFREELARAGVQDRDEHAAIAVAIAGALQTTGKTIVASGLIVALSLSGLLVINSPFFRGVALGVVIAVVCTLLVALTLLPALLAIFGPMVNRGHLLRWTRGDGTQTGDTSTRGRWAKWAHTVMGHPLIFGTLAATALVVASIPLGGVRYGMDMGTAALARTPSGQAATTLTNHFGPGLIAPIKLIATSQDDTALSATDADQAQYFVEKLTNDPRVTAAIAQPSDDGHMAFTVLPAVAYDSAAAADLVRDTRAKAALLGHNGGPQLLVGGVSAEFVDAANEITTKLPLVIGIVLAVSLAFLTRVFRSIVLPIKAVAMNLLATSAALGITVAVFQWGSGEAVLDFDSPGFIQVFLPALVFPILFGLSMDYEVFLIDRMKEYWNRTGNNRYAVAAGLAHTAGPITAAAAIMAVVFGSFITAHLLELQQIGFALATAITLDAIIVRLILVPALMRLAGNWNWRLPHRPQTPHTPRLAAKR